MTRVQFSKQSQNNQTIYYPYQLKESDSRLDIVAHKYYKESDYAWLVAMTNNVIDPYYDVGLTNEEFDDYIIGKYGSTNEAMESIAFWRNDWIADDSTIDISTFNGLLDGQKKYYNPVLSFEGLVIGYERKQDDWTVETNKIMNLAITANTALQTKARVQINNDTATAVVVFCNTSIMTIKDVQGVVANSGTITTNTSTISYSKILNTSFGIDPTEQTYWSPVSNYDYELELNTDKRNIKLLDNRLAQDTVKQMIKLLNR